MRELLDPSTISFWEWLCCYCGPARRCTMRLRGWRPVHLSALIDAGIVEAERLFGDVVEVRLLCGSRVIDEIDRLAIRHELHSEGEL